MNDQASGPGRPDEPHRREHADDDLDAASPARRPSPMMRFLVVVFGFILFGTGQAVADVGGVGAIVLGVLIMVLAFGVIAIAIGLVEYVAGRFRRT